ncbi:FG-GAP repeat domain-containing protein [Streptomyces sp. NRRL S-340]|uniref:FG-GAP repeat domain-containing protein n=1 Tax=Streptomyces sp. NRRL S-340 TaxID=1463901 RepID=UPI00056A971B|nr:VCBS repeat-containing protein [Streptomyces sp. NRRL S-340]
MSSQHTGRRRLGAAVVTVLAVTLATGSLAAAPAGAAPAAAVTAGAGDLLPMVPGARLASAGARGFMTYVPHDGEDGKLRWTPYAGGPSRDTAYGTIDGIVETSGDTAVVTTGDMNGTNVLDMSTGTSFGMKDVHDGLDSLYGGTAGSALFVRGATKLWLETKDAEPRPVQGMPEGASYDRVRPADATHGLLSVRTAQGGERFGLVDLTDATLTFPYPRQARNPVVRGNRLAWAEDDTATNTVRVVVRDRTTGAETAVAVPGTTAGAGLRFGLLGDWVTYGTTALHLRTGEKTEFLDHEDLSYTTPDGAALIVQGSSSARGKGFYRLSLGADGRPAVRLLAHAGTPTSALHDIDDDGLADLLGRDASGVLWRDSARDGRARARIGGGWQTYDKIENVGDIAGPKNPGFTPELVARDKDGVLWLYSGREDGNFSARVRVGPGWQTYAHITGGSDLTGDGRPDVVAVDRSGGLWLYRSTGSASRPFEARVRIGHGWDVYNQLVAVGDLAGSAGGDLVARDRDGVLWLYLGKGDGTYAQRTRIGAGWQVYSQLVGAGDVDHDGKADLFAYRPDTSTVYLYSGTGDATRPCEARTVSDAHTGHAYNHVS